MHLENDRWIDIENIEPFGEAEFWLMLGTTQNPSTYSLGWQI